MDTKAEEEKTQFREYVDSPENRVAQFYKNNHINQTYDYVIEKRNKLLKLDKLKMSVFDAALLLNEIVDDSDPDTDYPQIVHLLQTAEAIRQAYPSEEYDWFHLTGFIHDLGKILAHPKVFNEPQWAVVGDTFPLGCQFADTIIYSNYFKENSDTKHPVYSTKYGVYQPNVGLDNVLFSWGHDEYMYQVCVQNKSTLPPEALFVIRYHSCYAIHNKGEYTHLMDENDKKRMLWLKEFQRFDLYSKLPEKPNVDELLPYYRKLIDKYFPPILNW